MMGMMKLRPTVRVRHRRGVVATVVALTVLLLNSSIASAAWAIETGYEGHFKDSYSMDRGTLSDNYDANRRTFGPTAFYHWKTEAMNWMIPRQQYDGYYLNKVAISFHHKGANGSICADVFASNWFSSSMPNARIQRQSHCGGPNEEVRILFDRPLQSNFGYVDYYAQTEYSNGAVPSPGGEFNVSTYWLDYNDFPNGVGNSLGAPGYPEAGNGRDYSRKHCYSSPNSYNVVNWYQCEPMTPGI